MIEDKEGDRYADQYESVIVGKDGFQQAKVQTETWFRYGFLNNLAQRGCSQCRSGVKPLIIIDPVFANESAKPEKQNKDYTPNIPNVVKGGYFRFSLLFPNGQCGEDDKQT